MRNFIKVVWENIITKFVVLLTVIINLLIFNHYLASKVGISNHDLQNVYYFFSTSAQSIATFIAFLIAGYALVYQAMDNIENKDDTLIDIHHKIKADYYRKIKWLSVITGLAVVTSLTMIWLNGFDLALKNDVALITIFFVLLAIIGGLWFVIYIIDPNKIRKAARQLINERYATQGDVVDEGSLVRVFINLERTIRNAILDNDLSGRTQARRRELMSFREMLDILYVNELITRELHNRLLDVSRYRNLVVHGHILQVDENMVRETQEVLNEINRIIEERFNRNEE